MNPNDILSFVRNNYSSPKSVHERLYNDFSKRRETSTFCMSSGGSTFKAISGSRQEGVKIEDSLMQKMMLSKSKLSKLKIKYQTEELKEVRAVPQINEASRLIATKSEGKIKDLKSKFLDSIVKNSRSLAAKSNLDREVKKALIKISDENVEIIKEKEIRDRHEYLNFLRTAVLKRGQLLQHEEPPNLLEMDVVDRSHYWINLRKQKLEKLKQEIQAGKDANCTFSPAIQPRVNFKEVARSQSVSKSYSQIYLEKKGSKLNKKVFLRSLSPAEKRIGFEAGGDLDRLLKDRKVE